MRYRSRYVEPGAGCVSTAILEADSEEELSAQLRSSGKVLLRARPLLGDRARGLSNRQLFTFTQSIESLHRGGVPILSALRALADQEQDQRMSRVYEELGDHISRGRSLADAMKGCSRPFPQMYVELVRAGESSGSLNETFAYLASYLDWSLEIRSTVRQALVYPIVVLTAAYALVVFMLSFAVPRMVGILTKIAHELPASTRVLMGASDFVSANVLLIALGSIGAWIAAFFFVRSAIGSRTVATAFGHLPVTRRIVLAVQRALICRTLSVLLWSGLALIDCLRLTASIVSLRSLATGLGQVEARVLEGTSLTSAFGETRLLPSTALVLLRAGENSGQISESFQHLAHLYDRDARESVKKALALLEPAATVVLGAIIVIVAGVILNTIYGALQGLT